MAKQGYLMTKEEINKQIQDLKEEHKLLTYKTQGAIEILEKLKDKIKTKK
jgi:ribosomal protein L29